MALDDAYPSSATTLTTMTQWEAFFRGFGESGVIAGVGNEFVGSLDSAGRAAVLGTGAAQIRGFHTEGATTTSTAIPAADTQNRVDRLVLRLDRSAVLAPNWVQPVVIPGTPGSNPQEPALTQTDTGLYDLPICRWTSTSTGALTNLVDERYLVGGSTLAVRSTDRPSAAVRRLAIEVDTGRVVAATGSSWKTVYDDTGDLSFSLTSGWTTDGTCAGRKINGVVSIDINAIRSGGGITEGTTNVLATLPSALRPSRNKYAHMHLSNDNACRADITSDGKITLIDFVTSVATKDVCRNTITYIA